MHRNPQQISQPFKSPFKQRGAALIFMAFILGLGIAALAIKAFNADSLRHEQDQKTMQTLGEAKKALIAWAVSNRYSPGQLPWPDRNGDGNYDGSSDCVASAFQYSYLLGQLPSLPTTSPCLDPNTGLTVYTGLSTYPGLGQEYRDAQGNRLWYAVSRNMVRDYNAGINPVINPGIITAPTYNWLQVLDRNGSLVSDRVAAVIIAPGAAIGGQNRSGAADASEYLDSFHIGAAIYSNRGYATDDEDFIMGDDSRNVSASDATFVRPYDFNDKLVYITVDELMAALEKRVGEEVRGALKTYKAERDGDTPLIANDGYYPYAAQLGTTQNYSGEQSKLSGFLPVNYQSCTVAFANGAFNTANLNCVQDMFDSSSIGALQDSGITQIRITKIGGANFNSGTNGGCVVSAFTPTRCNCSAVGSCNGPDTIVSCNASSCFTFGSAGTVSYRVTGGKFTSVSGGCTQTAGRPSKTASCTNSNSRITCATNGGFASSTDARFDTALPLWFKANNWQDYVYYHITRPATSSMAVDSKSAEAVVVMAGRAINSAPFALSTSTVTPLTPTVGHVQTRPSCNALNNYLDSAENADGDTVYDATSTQRSASYNDQNFVVAP